MYPFRDEAKVFNGLDPEVHRAKAIVTEKRRKSMPKQLMPCDLCNLDVQKRQDSDAKGDRLAVWVDCPDCGKYGITEIAADALRNITDRVPTQTMLRKLVGTENKPVMITTDIMSSLRIDRIP